MDSATAQQTQVVVKPPANFAVALRQDGRVDKMADRTLEEYLGFTRDASVAWIDYTTKDLEKDLERIAQAMGFTQTPIQKMLSGFYSAYEDTDTELGIVLPVVKLEKFDMTVQRLVILIRGNFILTVHNESVAALVRFSRYAQTFIKKLNAYETKDKVTLILERIIDENNDRNFEYLREIEKHGDEISKQLIDENVSKKELAQSIYNMKHVLIGYLNVMWAIKDVVDSLQYGDADLITDDEKLLDRIGVLSINIDRHIELSEQMSNVLASGLEVMQSIYNNKLQTINNRFALVTAYLTVLGTAALVPNTIATIAGSGVFMDPNAQPVWYWPLLILSTIVATVASFLWVVKVWSKKGDDY
ncbi:CorA family divalent cation transporter [Methanocella conradii]|uniref:CorA family divalent cation transporter n=1 Tax=Methanocella conradii TaxID=1175444 RepID=UPI00157CA835|nr:CorA family divalent cation transporter [Methanocella conradii]